MIKAIQKHQWRVPNVSKTFFIWRNASRHSFSCVFKQILPNWLSWPSKRGCWRSWALELKCARKFLKCFAATMFVLASFPRIISIRRNKRGSRTTPQSVFIAANVRSQWFLEIDTLTKAILWEKSNDFYWFFTKKLQNVCSQAMISVSDIQVSVLSASG